MNQGCLCLLLFLIGGLVTIWVCVLYDDTWVGTDMTVLEAWVGESFDLVPRTLLGDSLTTWYERTRSAKSEILLPLFPLWIELELVSGLEALRLSGSSSMG